jgi:3-hydroxyacyl-[acyl-carrier-protein] dehydratase
MPAQLLFDISGIDLSRVAITREQVGAINPQCGDMRQLDHVIWTNENYSAALGVKFVREEEFWVPGHIPGRPLLPGVLMIEAAAQLSSVLYKGQVEEPRFIGFTRVDSVVFRGQVKPGDTLHLLAKEVSFRPRRFVCATQGLVNGVLVYEGQITGMVL